jgi:protein-S-isoprenylcysteine O-methyltransferase Ste14
MIRDIAEQQARVRHLVLILVTGVLLAEPFLSGSLATSSGWGGPGSKVFVDSAASLATYQVSVSHASQYWAWIQLGNVRHAPRLCSERRLMQAGD